MVIVYEKRFWMRAPHVTQQNIKKSREKKRKILKTFIFGLICDRNFLNRYKNSNEFCVVVAAAVVVQWHDFGSFEAVCVCCFSLYFCINNNEAKEQHWLNKIKSCDTMRWQAFRLRIHILLLCKNGFTSLCECFSLLLNSHLKGKNHETFSMNIEKTNILLLYVKYNLIKITSK